MLPLDTSHGAAGTPARGTEGRTGEIEMAAEGRSETTARRSTPRGLRWPVDTKSPNDLQGEFGITGEGKFLQVRRVKVLIHVTSVPSRS